MSAASYATVTATFPDPPAGLEVRFRPTLTQPIARLATVVPPLLYAVDEITVPVAEDGQLRGPDGQPGVRLLADPDLEPSGFTWQVRIVSPVTAPVEFAIAVTGGATVDLASVVPVPANLGQAVADWQAATAAALAARDEVIALAATITAGGSSSSGGGSLAVVDNGDGTLTITPTGGVSITDNSDGTLTLTA